MERCFSLLGLFTFIFFAWAISTDRKKVSFRLIGWGVGLQVITAVLVIGVPALGIGAPFGFLFSFLNDVVVKILAYSDEGARFVFGSLIDDTKFGMIFAFRILPTIIFFSSLMTVLYYFGILQKVVYGIAVVMKKTLRTSGPETLSAAGNIFLGPTESPLLIKPYLPFMSNSELLCIMVGGMANVAGGVLAAYVMLLQKRIPDIAGHLITVSVMSAPASLLVSKLLMPETKNVDHTLNMDLKVEDTNFVDAATRGASEGLYLALNVAAMLIAFVALVAMVNGLFGFVFSLFHLKVSLHMILGYLFLPVAGLLGIPMADIYSVGQLLGEKIVLNEFIAYVHLSEIGEHMSDRGVLIASYALCGFANISVIGISVGGIGSMAPERRHDLAKLGWRALIGGNLATFMCAAIVGVLT